LKNSTLIALVAAALLAAGCAGKRPAASEPGATEPVAAGSTDSSGAQTTGVTTVNAGSGAPSGGALGPDGPLGSQRVIYFDFDRSDIRNEYVDVIAAHGRFLAGNATVRVRLEGPPTSVARANTTSASANAARRPCGVRRCRACRIRRSRR
jgi:peptidoglycan-associated lipoprotein